MIKTWAVTDTGLVRKENQDTYRIARNGDICVVCDGMGGAAGGRLASTLASETYAAEMEKALKPDMTPEQLREYSHYPEKHFGQPHFLACYTDGPALLAVNKLRTVVRQTELAAYAAFRDADGNVTRGDMILGLNRLSSLMWIFMIKLKAGRYERK